MSRLMSIHNEKKETKKDKRDKAFKDGRRFWSEKEKRFFRSTWEIECAEMLTDLGIAYEYEPWRTYFKKEKESYLVDFVLPEYGVAIEVKGWLDRRSEKRCRLFRKYKGDQYGFVLWMSEERQACLNNPTVLVSLIEIAREEMLRRRLG